MSRLDLLQVGKRAVGLAVQRGAHQAEAFVVDTRSTSVRMDRWELKRTRAVRDYGIGIRIYDTRGSMGYAYATTFDTAAIEQAVTAALAQAKAGTPNPEFKSLPSPKLPTPVSDIYDEEVAALTDQQIVAFVLQTADAARSVGPEVYSASIEAEVSETEVAIVNSLGVEATTRSTFCDLAAEVTAKREGEMSSGFEFVSGRCLSVLDPSFVGRRAAEEAVRSLGAQKIETKRMPVILSPLALFRIFGRGLGDAVNAENVQRGRSYLKGLLGQEIGVKGLTILDDATVPGAVGTAPFDAEGVPSQCTTVIENGVLRSYLYDTFTAFKENRESTGNAIRSDYTSPPRIGITNLVVKPGTKTFEDLLAEVKEGLFLLYTWDVPNLATGDLSANVAAGYLFRDGAIAYPVKQATVTINMRDLFKRIIAIGNDVRHVHNVITPSILIAEATVAGAK